MRGELECNGCTACCRAGLVVVGVTMRPDGSCLHVGEKGCTIHGSRPQQCRDFDCRDVAASFSKNELRVALAEPGKVGSLYGIIKAGAERLEDTCKHG